MEDVGQQREEVSVMPPTVMNLLPGIPGFFYAHHIGTEYK
jgi:hypothetical protein